MTNEFVDFTVLIKRKIWLFKVEHCLFDENEVQFLGLQ
jgi:hypothetical protein